MNTETRKRNALSVTATILGAIDSKLPKHCFSVNETEEIGKRIVILTKGEMGYASYTDADGGQRVVEGKSHKQLIAFLNEVVDKMNADLNVSKAQRKAMEIGSMFGFHVPGAWVREWEK